MWPILVLGTEDDCSIGVALADSQICNGLPAWCWLRRPRSARLLRHHHVVPELHHHAGRDPGHLHQQHRHPGDCRRAPRARRFPRRSATSARPSSPSRAAPSCRRRQIPRPISRAAASGRAASAARPTSRSTSNSVGISTQGGAVINTANTNCNNQQHQTFAGAQVGADIARLNYDGWNRPSRNDGRLSRLADHRQRRVRQRLRSALLRHLFRRHQGTLLCRPDGSPGVLQHQPEQPGPCLQQPAGRGTRLVDLGIDGLQFRSGPGLVHRAVGRLHLFQDLGRQLHRARRRRRQLHRHHRRRSDQRRHQPDRPRARCGSARPSRRRT